MATVSHSPAARQPFAPLDGARLQTLTSMKNRQNAISQTLSPKPTKRKAEDFDSDLLDTENVDPVLFSPGKKAKFSSTDFTKPSTFILTASNPFKEFAKPAPSPISTRPTLTPRLPKKATLTSNSSSLETKHASLSAPAGRSPTRGTKRIGILNRRRSGSPTGPTISRIDPPKFALGAPKTAAPFCLAAALSGTIPSYGERDLLAKPSSITTPLSPSLKRKSSSSNDLLPAKKSRASTSGWQFTIHEDTEQELLHNLMEHGAQTLDLSSDEECDIKRRAEGKGKENVAPGDDVSQTTTRGESGRRRAEEEKMQLERNPLGDLTVDERFFGEGCDGASVVFVLDEEEEGETDYEPLGEEEEEDEVAAVEVPLFQKKEFDFSAPEGPTVEQLMQPSESEKAKLFEPLETAEEGFEVWESESAKGEEVDAVV